MIKKDIVETEIRTTGFNQVNRDILESSKKIDEYRESIQRLQHEKSKLVSAGKKESAEYKNITKELGVLKDTMEQERAVRQEQMKGLKLTEMSYNQLKKQARELRQELINTSSSAESKKYAELSEELGKVERHMNKLSQGLKQVSQDMKKEPGVWGNALSKVKNYLPAFKISEWASKGIDKVVDMIGGSVREFRAYDEALVDAMKTTGQSKEGIKAISEELKKIDTRTSQNDLLGLARVAGKLGIDGSEDIEGFVRAADKINVALSEDLGGNTEEAINEIGKLVDIFNLEDKYGIEDAMIRVGSTINELGASSTANEGYLVDFAKRVAGIAPNANISIESVLGLAAALDKTGQFSEASSTVVIQTLSQMFTKPAKFAKMAGMEVKAFINMINTDANGAFIKVLEGIKGNDAAMMDIANNLDDMEVRGTRGKQVLGDLAAKIGDVVEQQQIANKAFADGTSVIDESDQKNNSAEARREKRLKETTDALVAIGEILEPIYDSFLAGSTTVMNVLASIIKVLYEYKWALVAVTGGYVAYNAAMKIWNTFKAIQIAFSSRSALTLQKEAYAMLAHSVALRKGTADTVGYTIATKALAIAKALLTLNFRAAAVAVKAFFVALGPVGWVITALTAMGTAIAIMYSKTDKLSASQVALNEVNANATNNIRAEKNELERLMDVAEDKTASDKRRANAISQLQKLMPNGIDLINQETVANGLARKSVEDYCQALLLRAKLEAAKKYLVDYETDRLKQLQEGATDVTWWQTAYAVSKDLITLNSTTGSKTTAEFAAGNQAEFNLESQGVTNKLTTYINTLETKIGGLSTINPLDDAGKGNKCKKCGKSRAQCTCSDDKQQKEWSLQNDKDFAQQKLALTQQLFNGKFAAESDYNEAVANLEIKTLEDRLKLTSVKGEERAKLEQELATKKYNQTKAYQAKEDKLQDIADGGKSPVEQENVRYDKQLQELGLFNVARENMTAKQLAAFEVLEKQHGKKLLDIRSAADKKTLSDIQISNGLEMSELRRKQAEELSLLTSDSDIKQAKARHKKEQQQLQYKQTEELIKEYQNQLAKFNEQGSALGELMTDEDKKKLETIINDLIFKLKELGVEINKTPETGAKGGSKVDILGMSADGWETMFKNLSDGKGGIEEWGAVIGAVGEAIGSAFSDVSNLMSAIEERELKKYEKAQNKKKKALDQQLKAGTISQERYNEKVQVIDEETEAKKLEIERKQAERQKMLAVFQALVNTAVAITSAIAQGGPIAGPILAGIVGALGAIQVAAIIAQPLPGAEQGGLLVERTQDGARYNAEFEPQKRGKIDKPTVIVGENGTEYVVPADGYNNPTVRPILNMIEQARLRGTLNTIDLPNLIAMQGLAGGGYATKTKSSAPSTANEFKVPYNSSDIADILVQLNGLLDKLSLQLDTPLAAYVTMAGDNGVAKNLEKFYALQKRATING